MADAAAKVGVQRHRLRTTERMEMMRWAAVAAAAVAIGHQVWDLWPEVGRFDQIPRAPPADPAPRVAVLRHRWVRECARTYRCIGCGRVARGLSVHLITGRCKGRCATQGLAAVLRGGHGHLLCAVYGGETLPRVVCTACGAWAKGRPVKLLQTCTGHPTTAGRSALVALAAGRLPGRGGACEGIYRISEGSVDFRRAVQYN